jgi:peptide/nickel transport system permease protein
MASAVILFAYVTIGLLDSIHFHPRLDGTDAHGEVRYATEVLSFFDVIVAPLRRHVEKTYSAPFATHLYAKETVELPDGREVRAYPRLKYGGAHLKDPAKDRIPDILHTSAIALIQALGVWIVFAVFIIGTLARAARTTMQETLRAVVKRYTVVPWDVILITSGVLLASIFLAAHLGVKYHILGTDKVGQDVFYQALKSVRTGLIIGTLTTLVMLPFAILLGIYTTLNSIPGVLLIAAAILMMQVYMANHADSFTSLEARADVRLLFLVIILGITSWTGLCRLLRGEALKLREIDYIQAAQAFGVGHFSIITRHILPNVMHIVLITVVLDFSALVLVEAVLSYINIGVDPSMQSWGNMINSARLELARDPIVWWSLTAAFIFMFGLVLSANLFSDTVRDAFDPRLRITRA